MRVAILTISTAAARGDRVDTSGDTIEAWVAGRAAYELVLHDLMQHDGSVAGAGTGG